jgi:hypothetical protein
MRRDGTMLPSKNAYLRAEHENGHWILRALDQQDVLSLLDRILIDRTSSSAISSSVTSAGVRN